MQDICSELRLLLSKAVNGRKVDGVLLSGGLDSSILASLVGDKKPRAYVMVAKDFASTDLVNALLVANKCGIEIKVISASTYELLDAIDKTIEILGVFNPIEIRNSIVVFIAMTALKKDGFRSVMTGDGADELFAGYHFFQRMTPEELQQDLERIWRVMHFPSQKISKSLGLELYAPFLDEKVIIFAKSISEELKIREEDNKRHGKWILRKTFEKSLPQSIIWREKAAMQDGSGTCGLPGFFDNLISDATFLTKAKRYLEKEGVKLQSKESLYYYEIYRKYWDCPELLGMSETRCPNCKFPVDKESRFCWMCGSYPI